MSDSKIPSNETVEPHRNSDEAVTNAYFSPFFTTYMNGKLPSIERIFNDKTHSLAKKMKKADTTFLTGNIERTVEYVDSKMSARATKLLEDSIQTLKRRNKLIRIAHSSEGG